jgi:hypothetical protein
VDNFDDYHEEFFRDLDNPIAQCRFCPTEKIRKKLFTIKKSTEID